MGHVSYLKMTHITLINLKREIIVLILASAVNMGHFYIGHPHE